MQAILKVFVPFALVTGLFLPQLVQAQKMEESGGMSALPETPRRQPQAAGSLTLGERFRLEARLTLGISAFLVPATEAGIRMAHPPGGYPREWSDGPGAFGRNYGAGLARHTAGGLTRFAVAAADREDPRYYASARRGAGIRFAHAVGFTLRDRAMSGRRRFALSNFAGAAAAGFSGMPYEPEGFNDASHAAQRAGIELGSFGMHNVVTEFAPEIARTMRKMHLPQWMAGGAISENAVRP